MPQRGAHYSPVYLFDAACGRGFIGWRMTAVQEYMVVFSRAFMAGILYEFCKCIVSRVLKSCVFVYRNRVATLD